LLDLVQACEGAIASTPINKDCFGELKFNVGSDVDVGLHGYYLDRARHRCEACGSDIPGGAASGNQIGCKQAGGDDNGKAETVAGRSGSGGCSLDELRFGMREVHFERITGNRRISPSIN
jgi:hypothetical protein